MAGAGVQRFAAGVIGGRADANPMAVVQPVPVTEGGGEARQQGLVPCARADMAVQELGPCDALSQLWLLRGVAVIAELGVAAVTFQVDELGL